MRAWVEVMGRPRCSGCDRPSSVCLCGLMPSPPLRLTRTSVVVLQHPHEARHKLSTLPILRKCLADCHILQGRRLKAGDFPLVDFFAAHHPSPFLHALLLFPSPSAQPITAKYDLQAITSSADRLPEAPSSQDLAVSAGSRCAAASAATSCLPSSETDLSDAGYCMAVDSMDGCPSCHVANCSLSDRLNKQHDLDFIATGCMTGDSLLTCPACHVAKGSLSDSLITHAACYSKPSVLNSCEHARTLMGATFDANACWQKGGTCFPHILLIAVDATWQHANEMVKASASYLDKFAAPVCLPFDADEEGSCMANSESILRKEPFKGCMSTLEAVACCLKVLEPNGAEIHGKLLCVLRHMVQFQASNIMAHKVRVRKQRGSIDHSHGGDITSH